MCVDFCSLYTIAMDRDHVIIAVLLNLISVQVTFGRTGEHLLYLAPTYERSMGARPIIQAQFHPASGTIQQGIMLPQEHFIPQERIPEDLYYQERIMPQESTFYEQRVPPEPQERIVPLESAHRASFIPQGELNHENRERMVPQGFMKDLPNTERALPEEPREEISQERMVSQENVQKIVHTNPAHLRPQHKPEQDTNNRNTHLTEEDRAVKGGYEYPHQTYPQTPSYGYNPPPPSYAAPAPSTPTYSTPSAPYSPPHPDQTKFLKPDLTDLIKPVTGKMAGKLNGLTGLVLSLLSSGKGLELTGIKELLIDGILKPLFAAKGGLKALISKLAIPIVALILINVEVLITVWWLWEDCPAVKEIEVVKPSYPPASPPAYTSNY